MERPRSPPCSHPAWVPRTPDGGSQTPVVGQPSTHRALAHLAEQPCDSVYLSQRSPPVSLHSLGLHVLSALSALLWAAGPSGPAPPRTHLLRSRTRKGHTVRAQRRPGPCRTGRPATQPGPWSPGKSSRAPAPHVLWGRLAGEGRAVSALGCPRLWTPQHRSLGNVSASAGPMPSMSSRRDMCSQPLRNP